MRHVTVERALVAACADSSPRASEIARTASSRNDYAREHFAPAPYLLAADALGAQLRRTGATPDMAITNTVAAVSHELFAEVPEPSPQAR